MANRESAGQDGECARSGIECGKESRLERKTNTLMVANDRDGDQAIIKMMKTLRAISEL